MQTITTQSELESHITSLVSLDKRFANIYMQTGVPWVRHKQGGFSQLCSAIISQQLSVAAANSIWQRFLENGFIDEENLLIATDEQLRECGLSKQKIRYIRSLANHHINYERLKDLPDDEVIKTLTEVIGIGRWTAEIYCLFSLNRTDAFAHNDLALQVATQEMLNLEGRPKEREMIELAKNWAPHRSAAAYILWKYYALIKGREGIN